MKLRDLFDSFGITYQLDDVDGKDVPNLEHDDPVTVLSTDSGIGWVGMIAAFYFDNNGKFLHYGVWE